MKYDLALERQKAEEARVALEPLIAKVWSYCEGSTVRGRTATLKAKFDIIISARANTTSRKGLFNNY